MGQNGSTMSGGASSSVLDVQPWLDLEKEAYEAESRRDDFTGDAYSEESSRNRLAPLDDTTKRLLITAIRHWRTLERQTLNRRENLTRYWHAWRGGEADNDIYGNEDPNRPHVEDWLIHTREFLNERWPLYNSLVSFSKFCPSEVVKQYLARMEEEYRDLVDESPGRIAHVEENRQALNDAATKVLVIREKAGQEREAARQAELERIAREALGREEAARIAREEEEEDRLRQGDLDPRLGWVGPLLLGEGSQGSADLHIRQNVHGRIVDRLVIKNARLPPADNPLRWVNGQVGGVPFAVKALFELRSLLGSESIIKIRNWRMNTDKGEYRQYMEYCPFGDLHRLISHPDHGYAGQMRTKAKYFNDDRSKMKFTKFVPEPFVWYVLEHLTLAGLLMERGELDRYGLRPWNLILHGDIKNANIFLGGHSSKQFKNYPEPKLGDWDVAIALLDGIDGRKRTGTKGWKAPEVEREDKGEPSSKSNVYNAGLIAWSLMGCTWDGYLFDGANAMFAEEESPKLDKSARVYYSQELIALVEQCTTYQPESRPTFDEMRAAILRHTSGGPSERALGLRSLPKDDPTWTNESVALPPKYLAENFGLQKALGNVELDQNQKKAFPQGIPAPPTHMNEGLVEDYGGRMGEKILGKRKAVHVIPDQDQTDGSAGSKKQKSPNEGDEGWVIVGESDIG